ncbi:type VI secretion system protein TssA [Paraburkholderia sediminicola]|uniref:type VI secretion system protein TssA n=1 Tax=Paraburkholderia sediminicola TaxID=458836 RepID=UPI0038BCD53C
MMFANFIKQIFGGRNPDDFVRARIDTWAEWLRPLQSVDGGGVGRDPGYDDAFMVVKEEIGKLSDIDNALIASSCEQLIKQVGKDLRLAGYYVFARVRQDGAAGFADGLELAAALIDRFGPALLPARDEAKRTALEWVATARVLDQLDRHDAFAPADLERAMAALNLIMGRTGEWAEAARPNLQPLVSRFEGKDEPARADTDASVAHPGVLALSSGATAIASTRDALEQARLVAQFLRNQENGYLPSVRLIRCVRWDTLHDAPPADGQGRTRLAPPRSELRQQLKRLVLQKQWHELLERVEGAYMEGVNHLWLDLQYFQHIALDHAGAPYTEWRDILRADFALFLERLDGIERLAFSDGTAFADDATLEWIASHAVVRNLDEGEALAALPVSTDDENGAAGNWQEMELQARELTQSQGLDAALAWLSALPGIRSDRQRYLQRWVMARVADHAGRADTALHLLGELDEGGQAYQLTRWEPSLTFEVKHHLLTTLKALLTRKDADKPALAQRIEKLRGELTVLDPARAVALL